MNNEYAQRLILKQLIKRCKTHQKIKKCDLNDVEIDSVIDYIPAEKLSTITAEIERILLQNKVKLMNNDITINVDELLLMDDNSITDYETIRQIGLLSCTKNDIPKEKIYKLHEKVRREFQYCGLYPNVMTKFDILPDKLK